MNNQIRVAANGRSEVGVGGRSQRKVANIRLRIARLHQRAQHQIAQNPLFRLAFDFGSELLIHARSDEYIFRHFVGADVASRALSVAAVRFHLYALHGQRAQPERVAEAGGQLLELHHAARFRLLVDAIERRHAHVFKPCGDTFVGGQHELFDQPVGPCALGFGHAAHLSLLIKLDHRLGKIEVNASPLLAPFVHQHRKLVHSLEVGNEAGITRASFRIALENCVDFGVRHARSRADHAFNNFIALDAARRIELHDATQHQPVFARPQAANVRR